MARLTRIGQFVKIWEIMSEIYQIVRINVKNWPNLIRIGQKWTRFDKNGKKNWPNLCFYLYSSCLHVFVAYLTLLEQCCTYLYYFDIFTRLKENLLHVKLVLLAFILSTIHKKLKNFIKTSWFDKSYTNIHKFFGKVTTTWLISSQNVWVLIFTRLKMIRV